MRRFAAAFGAMALCACVYGATGKLQIVADETMITVQEGERPIARYRYGEGLFKPYVKELYTPGGVNVLLDSPHDHVHHHGLMFAVGVDGTDFWSETADCGVQRDLGAVSIAFGGGSRNGVGFSHHIRWVAPGDREVLAETRTVGVERPEGEEVTLLTWTGHLSAAGGGARTIAGAHYFGLGMRFVRAMDRTGVFLNADGLVGEVFRGDERLVRSRWCAYTAEIDGKAVTVAMFDGPGNPRRPATWFTMKEPFAYLSGTLGLHAEALTIEDGASIVLTYGAAVWDGRIEAEAVEAMYRKWLSLTGYRGK